ncbi:MAG: hypothetical protein Kow0092_22660 [Deferrisomatales bacterium]
MPTCTAAKLPVCRGSHRTAHAGLPAGMGCDPETEDHACSYCKALIRVRHHSLLPAAADGLLPVP